MSLSLQVVSRALLVGLLSAMALGQSETTTEAPRTQDEKLVDEQSTADPTAPPRPWNRVQGDLGRFDFSAALLGDFFLYGQDDESLSQVGDLTEFERPEVRAFRLGGTGALNFKRPWTFIFYVTYRGFDRGWDRTQDDAWTIFDLAVNIPIPKVGTFTFGKTKEPFSLERLTVGVVLPLMERSAGGDVLMQSRNSGFKLSNSAFQQRMTWSGGWFPGFLEKDTFARAHQWIGRVTTVPVDGRDGDGLLHLGVAARHSYKRGSEPVIARYRGSPEAYSAPDFLDTGELSMDYISQIGLEAAYRKGPFWISSEWITARPTLFETSSLPDENLGKPRFQSFYVQASYVLTGEHRPYDRRTGVFGLYVPRQRVGAGGAGLWELAFRYSYADLQDKTIRGGVLDRWSAGLNWMPLRLLRFQVNYGLARLDKDGVLGTTHILQGRALVFF